MLACTSFLVCSIGVTGYAVAEGLEMTQSNMLMISGSMAIAPFVGAGVTMALKISIAHLGRSGLLYVNYTSTVLLEARAAIEDAIAGKINQNELRIEKMGAIDAFVASTPSLIAGGQTTLDNLKKSSRQATKINILKDLTSNIDTVRSCGATEEGDSAQMSLSYVTRSKGFRMSELLYADNDIGYQAAFNHNMARTMRWLHHKLDQDCIATLEANKSAVNAGSLNTFDSVLDTMEVSLANQDSYWGNAYAELMENKFVGPYFNVHTIAQIARWNRLMNQGAGNATNQQYQLGDFKNYASANFPAPSGSKDASYFFVPGTVGMVPWANALHRKGAVSGAETWTTFPDPLYPIIWELKIKSGCVDRSSITTGGEADLVTEFRLSAEFAYISAYTSNTDTGIYKYVQKTS